LCLAGPDPHHVNASPRWGSGPAKKYYFLLNFFTTLGVLSSEKLFEGEIVMAELSQVNWALFAPIIVIQLILMGTALVDLIRNEETNGPKLFWVLLILLVSIIGPILYFVVGRKK
jgi:hypothetical protein